MLAAGLDSPTALKHALGMAASTLAASAFRAAPAGARLKTRFSLDASSPPVFAQQPASYVGSAAAAAAAGVRQAAAAAASYDRYDRFAPDDQDWQQQQERLAYTHGGSAGGAAPLRTSSVNGSPADSGLQMIFSNAGMGLVSTGSGRFVSNGPSLAAAETALELQGGFDDLQAVDGEEELVSAP
jgi:hypothetical protein